MVEHRAEQVHIAWRAIVFGIEHYPDAPSPLDYLPYESVAGLDPEIPYPFDTSFDSLCRRMILAGRNVREPQCGAEASCREQPEVDELHSEQSPEPVVSQGVEQGAGNRFAVRECGKVEEFFRMFIYVPDAERVRQHSV